MAGYTKEFLVEAFAHRFLQVGRGVYNSQLALANSHYDKVGKDIFRIHASLDADALRNFRKYMNEI
jgi:hypothetical protein